MGLTISWTVKGTMMTKVIMNLYHSSIFSSLWYGAKPDYRAWLSSEWHRRQQVDIPSRGFQMRDAELLIGPGSQKQKDLSDVEELCCSSLGRIAVYLYWDSCSCSFTDCPSSQGLGSTLLVRARCCFSILSKLTTSVFAALFALYYHFIYGHQGALRHFGELSKFAFHHVLMKC